MIASAVNIPKSINDLQISQTTLEYGAELQADHPGFNDTVYRARRRSIVQLSYDYRPGQPLPSVDYLDVENETWKTIVEKLSALFPTHACRQFNEMWKQLEFRSDKIPQLAEVSARLQKATGWTLRPVAGLLSSRDFLAGLAFRVFHSTQYIRHHSMPLYTPEPDVCHELLGHAPMLADPEFALLSEKIGQASLGATDEDIDKLATVYWFSVEFGLVREGASVRAYGAGLLSSYGELQHSLSGAPEYRAFDPFEICKQPYPITQYQPILYVADSFAQATHDMEKFASSLAHRQ